MIFVAQIEDNMVLGIGTGSTIELLIPKLVERIHKEQLNITGVCANKSAFIAKKQILMLLISMMLVMLI